MTVVPSELVAFLRTRLGEDEQVAREASDRRFPCPPHGEQAGDERWQWVYSSTDEPVPLADPYAFDVDRPSRTASLQSINAYMLRSSDGVGHHVALSGATVGGTTALHIARHDPARVLAEVAARRRIVDEYERVASAARGLEVDDLTLGALDALERVLVLLTALYADHPEHRPEWR